MGDFEQRSVEKEAQFAAQGEQEISELERNPNRPWPWWVIAAMPLTSGLIVGAVTMLFHPWAHSWVVLLFTCAIPFVTGIGLLFMPHWSHKLSGLLTTLVNLAFFLYLFFR